MKKENFDINKVTKNLFADINEKERLVPAHTGKLFLNGVEVSEAQKIEIISQAETLKSLDLVEILFREMEGVACHAMYEQGGDDTEMLKHGKSMLYTIDVLRKKIHNLSRLKK
tara:strand:+ start:4226 stop:4564 length:339 start_codon:yes stop_codon:yes gene_type:complete